MAKRGRKPKMEGPEPTSQEGGGLTADTRDSLGDFAEDLGTFLGTAERRASEWLAQRKRVAEQLIAVRDKASSLLSQLGIGQAFPVPGGITPRRRRPGRPPRNPPTENLGPMHDMSMLGGPGGEGAPTRRRRRKRKPMSAEARAKIAEAQRRRWARYKRGER